MKHNGQIKCPDGPCTFLWDVEQLEPHLEKATLTLFIKAVRDLTKRLVDKARSDMRDEYSVKESARIANDKTAKMEDRIREHQIVIAESLNLRCPNCSAVFVDHAACECLE